MGTTFDAIKKDSFGITFYKNVISRIFFKFSAKRVLFPLGHISNKVNRDIVQNPDKVGTYNWPAR